MHVALDAAGNDLLRTVVAVGMRQQCRDQQRLCIINPFMV